MKDVVKGEIIVCDAPEQVPEDVDAIITVTQAKDSFLKAEWIRPGTVVFPMGSYKEIEDEVIITVRCNRC